MCERIYPCLDSGQPVLMPIKNDQATCGCCGRRIKVVVDPDDPNRTPRYGKHGPRGSKVSTHEELDYQDGLAEARAKGWLRCAGSGLPPTVYEVLTSGEWEKTGECTVCGRSMLLVEFVLPEHDADGRKRL